MQQNAYCCAITISGAPCRRRVGSLKVCPAHNPKLQLNVPAATWVPAVIAFARIQQDHYLRRWAEWIWSHVDRLGSWDELNDDQCAKLALDLGYISSARMLRCVEACSMNGRVFMRVTNRQMDRPVELLATAAHELVHSLLPAEFELDMVFEEAICVSVENLVNKPWIVDADLRAAIHCAVAMHPANRSKLSFGLSEIQTALFKLFGSPDIDDGGLMGLHVSAETVDATLRRIGVCHDALHVCHERRERLLCDAIERHTFGSHELPVPVSEAKQVLLVHGDENGTVQTMLRVHVTLPNTLYIDNFVSAVPRRGHGTATLAMLCRLALARDIHRICLHSKDLPLCCQIYMKMGFNKVEAKPDYVCAENRMVLWEMKL